MKNFKFLVFTLTLAIFSFTSCSSDDDGGSIVDGMTGNYRINVFNENNELTKKDMIISKAGETSVLVKLPNFENQGYSYGDVEILCSVVDEEGELYFSGSTNVTATKATYETTFSISGYADGDRVDLDIEITAEGFNTQLSTSGRINNNQNNQTDNDNEGEDEGENEEDGNITSDEYNKSMLIGKWNAIHYRDKEVSFSVPSYITWTMTIGADGSFSAYKFIPAEDEEEDDEVESYEGEWRIDGKEFKLVVNGYDYGFFRILSIENNELQTTTGEGDVTTWRKQ